MRVLIAVLLLLVPTTALALPITYDFRADAIETIDEVNSFSLIQDGLTATLTAYPTTFDEPPLRDVVLNRTASAFGVNVVGTTCNGAEDSARIDGGCAGESIGIIFDQDVYLNTLMVSSFQAGTDEGLILFNRRSLPILNTGLQDLGGLYLSAGAPLTVAWVSGGGYSLDNVTVTRVPEPTTLLLLGSGLIVIATLRRRLRASLPR